MLDELRVVNLGILEDATIEPGEGLTIVSGETGAGKTMLLGALRLLTGQRAAADVVGPNAPEARVEGRLVVGDHDIVLSRRINARGSRAYLDGKMVPNRVLDETTDELVEIVGQDDRFHLLKPNAMRALVDSGIDDTGSAARYKEAWRRVLDLEEDLERLGGDRGALERERDVLRYQLNDITSARLRPGDDAALSTRVARLRSAGELTERLDRARTALDAISDEAGDLIGELRSIAKIDPATGPMVENAGTLAVLAAELAGEVRMAAESVDHNPASLEEAERSFARLVELRRKYGPSLDDVLEFAAATDDRLRDLDGLLDRADSLRGELDAAKVELEEAGAALRDDRREAALRIEAKVTGHLADLGLGDAMVKISVDASTPGPEGADLVKVVFASDPRMTPGPLERIGSGGELSRVVLALRLATNAGDAPILAFDEIDAGVGGETALALGRKLAALSRERQVLCVTHLPQVAAFADHHFVVARNGAAAVIEQVEGESRLRELARMLAGLPESTQGRLHAQELLSAAQSSPPAPGLLR